MIADDFHKPRPSGNLDAGVLELGAFCREIVTFVETELPVWRQRLEIAQVEGEPRLNQSLCLHLERARRHKFDFIRFFNQPLQSPNREADIGAFPLDPIVVEGVSYQDYEQLLPIECKLFPTPPDSRRSDLEYVHGLPGYRTGGIERFKHGLHGQENQHALMIAYVQANSFAHWQSTINTRLTELAANASTATLWSPVERLSSNSLASNGVLRLQSRHKRIQPPCCSPIMEVEHLWVSMPRTASPN